MHRPAALVLLACSSLSFAQPPEEDRRAILSMAGHFDVTFDFKETVAVAPDYEPLSKDYHEEALEVVLVVEDTPERIALQHLLVVGGKEKRHVIKHWAQIWTWQDTRLLDYSGSEGDNVWTRVEVSAEEARGKWSQLVTSVDDTPRYEGLGKWVHRFGESSWTSEPTRRPLPRREYEKRDDYDYLLGTNRHTLTAAGWVHFQDNSKVVDRDGTQLVLSYESGINRYTRTENPLASEAVSWWEKNGAAWNLVRDFWVDAGEQSGGPFSYRKSHRGTSLAAKFAEFAETETLTAGQISEALTPYLSVSK